MVSFVIARARAVSNPAGLARQLEEQVKQHAAHLLPCCKRSAAPCSLFLHTAIHAIICNNITPMSATSAVRLLQGWQPIA